MQTLLNDLISAHLFAFLLIFMRFGMALTIMPGIGDSFVSPNIRVMFALAISFVVTPFLVPKLPPMPAGAFPFVMLLATEALVGVFIGTVMRIMITALDTAGSVVSIQAGFANAMVFNPLTSGQGSLVGALYSSLGVTLMLTLDMHHYMLASVVESYALFPATEGIPDIGAMSEVISRTVALAFKVGVQMAVPFLVVGLIIQTGFGVLGRLMPQVQIFFLALPVQILLSLIIMAMSLSVAMMYWARGFESVIIDTFSP